MSATLTHVWQNYDKEIESEISRLLRLGWKDFPPESSGIRKVVQLELTNVSYPSESYDPELGNQEGDGVWASHRAQVIADAMQKNGANVLWEIGSGDGNVALPLRDSGKFVVGVEPLISGARVTADAGIRTYLGTFESLKLPSESLDAVGVFDVLEHLENPESLLREIHRVLKPGGILLTTVPAHMFLFSDFDLSIGHFRRYSKKELLKSLEGSNFENSKAIFMFSLLVLPAFLLRRVPTLLGRNRNSHETISSCQKQSAVLMHLKPLLRLMFKIEGYLKLPFGLSLFSISKK